MLIKHQANSTRDQFRQLRDVGRDPPGVVARWKCGCENAGPSHGPAGFYAGQVVNPEPGLTVTMPHGSRQFIAKLPDLLQKL
jgi:hypothetical protein